MFSFSPLAPIWARERLRTGHESRPLLAATSSMNGAPDDVQPRTKDNDPAMSIRSRLHGCDDGPSNDRQHHQPAIFRSEVEAQSFLPQGSSLDTGNLQERRSTNNRYDLRNRLDPTLDDPNPSRPRLHTNTNDRSQEEPNRLNEGGATYFRHAAEASNRFSPFRRVPRGGQETSRYASNYPRKQYFGGRHRHLPVPLDQQSSREQQTAMLAQLYPDLEDKGYITSTPTPHMNNASRESQTMDASAPILPQFPHPEQQLLDQIEEFLNEQGTELRTRVSDVLTQSYKVLSERLAKVASDDEEALEQCKRLDAELCEPLAANLTYNAGVENATTTQVKLGDEVERMKTELSEFQHFVDDKWKEWDAAKTAENEGFEQLIRGLGESSHDKTSYDKEFKKLNEEIKSLEDQASEEMKECFENFQKEKRLVEAKQAEILWDEM